MVYRQHDIRTVQVRGETGYVIHNLRGDLLFRCGSEEEAKKKIDKLCDEPSERRRV